MDRLSVLLEYLEQDPEDPFTRFALALEYLKSGKDQDALSVFEGLLAARPDYVGTYFHLGALYERLGQRESALETYRTGIRIAEEQRDLHARSELQSALLEAEGVGFDDE